MLATTNTSWSAGASGTVERILSCTSFEQTRNTVLEPLTRAVGATSGVFVQFLGLPLDGDIVGQRFFFGGQSSAVDIYAEGLYALDPMVQPALEWLHSGADAQSTFVTALSEIPGWRDQVCYRKFLERFGIGHVLAAAVPVRTGLGPQIMCIGFHRPERAGCFSETEIGRLKRLAPVLRPVLGNLAYREALSLTGTVLDEVADAGKGFGILVLDEDLRVRQANGRGLSQLCLQRNDHFGHTIQPEVFATLRKHLLDGPPSVGRSRRAHVSAPNIGSNPSVSLDIEIRTFCGTDLRVYYVLIVSEAGLAMNVDAACARLSLTGREVMVARLICAGQGNAAIARELSIARRTVENHLRSIYSKVGVNSRCQLVSRLLGHNEWTVTTEKGV